MNVFIEQRGYGTPIVFIHGWGMHGGLWGAMADHMEGSARVYLVDLPGHGRSTKSQHISVDSMARVVAGALDDLSEPAAIVGWSMGAFVAFAMAQQFPDRFARLVWVSGTPSFVERPGWSAGMERDVFEGFAGGLDQDPDATLKRFISLNGASRVDRRFIKNMQQQALERGPLDPSVLKQGLEILRDSDIREELSHSTMPMLLLQGSQDRLVHADTVDAVAGLRTIDSHIFPDLGHAPFVSEPVAVARSILEFCA